MLAIRSTTFSAARDAILELGGYAHGEPRADHEDKSFVILDGDAIAGVMPTFLVDGVACFYDTTSIIPFYASQELSRAVNATICEWARDLLERRAALSIKILTNDALLEALSRQREFAISDNTREYAWFDLRREPAALWSSIRKSYRSLIHAGERSLRRTVYAGGDSVDPQVLEFLTTSPHTARRYDFAEVQVHLDRLKCGTGLLFAYSLESRVVGVVGIRLARKFSATGDHFYELAAYDNTSSVPVHFCLFDALNFYRTNQLGNRVFLLYGEPLKRPEHQAKLANIDFFKRGYCSDSFIRPYKTITWLPAHPDFGQLAPG
jgi:hypothetical protein